MTTGIVKSAKGIRVYQRYVTGLEDFLARQLKKARCSTKLGPTFLTSLLSLRVFAPLRDLPILIDMRCGPRSFRIQEPISYREPKHR